MNFDEMDLNIILSAILCQISTEKWDVTRDSHWENLVALKNLQRRISQELDGE